MLQPGQDGCRHGDACPFCHDCTAEERKLPRQLRAATIYCNIHSAFQAAGVLSTLDVRGLPGRKEY